MIFHFKVDCNAEQSANYISAVRKLIVMSIWWWDFDIVNYLIAWMWLMLAYVSMWR